VDLLQPGQTSAFFASLDVPTGRVTQLHVVLASDPSLEFGGEIFSVSCPSCDQTGIKIVPAGTLEVPEDGLLELALDFESALSLTPQGYRLDPVVQAKQDAVP